MQHVEKVQRWYINTFQWWSFAVLQFDQALLIHMFEKKNTKQQQQQQ